MTPIELHRLAGAVSCLRPDWPASSLQAFLARHFTHRPPRDIAVALVYVALDTATETPGRVLEPGPWWQAASTSDVPIAVNDCGRHPLSRLRVDLVTGASVCSGCHVDERADDTGAIRNRGGRPIPETARELVTKVLRPATPDDATRDVPAIEPTREATA